MNMVMEKSWNMKNWPKVMDFVISHGILPISPQNCTKFAHYLATTKKSSIDIESTVSDVFHKISQIQN